MYLKDPRSGQKSVSLTLMMVSFASVLVCSFAHMAGKLDSTGPLLELFYATAALYFGRRFKHKGAEIDEKTK